MSYSLKEGVNPVEELHASVRLALPVVESLYDQYGAELVITSTTDSDHGPRSYHYGGFAFDIRTWQFSTADAQVVAEKLRWLLREKLDSRFDVVWEPDHIHVELDVQKPKEQRHETRSIRGV